MLFAAEAWVGDRQSALLAGEVFGYGYMVFVFHWTLLTGKPLSTFRRNAPNANPRGAFWLVIIGVSVLGLAIALVIAFVVTRIVLEDSKALLGVFLLVTYPAIGLILAVFGTLIPVAVLGDPLSLSENFTRAGKSFSYVLWRLIAGPGVASIAYFALIIASSRAGILPAPPTSLASITLANAAFGVFVGAYFLSISALTASILSMAYLHVEEGRRPAFPLPPQAT